MVRVSVSVTINHLPISVASMKSCDNGSQNDYEINRSESVIIKVNKHIPDP